ncbi:hypothetical protein LJ656_32640 [Paraburkholderia sp. MMS20-SJTR3]|uniref:Uncharacterized protein n=1 Tax=Paraburkholderia sejongensis TaxID=2886946 RepID=A0ABS8K588_9BURK|nr:hypothetical protein [Paraburkholderia sp. MMS20-SJTR3]MCC8397325.1 hypothetical protein [Paraburkholderia sp. MMS20-SJTR3]
MTNEKRDPLKRAPARDYVFGSTGRSAYGVFSLVVAVSILLAWISTFDGPAVRICHDYWRWVAPVGIPAAIVIAWRIRKALVGSWYKPRYASQERQMGVGESWATGAIAAAVLVMFATGAFANVMNQVIGVSYVARYEVAGKYIEKGKHTCYGLTIVNVGDPLDQFQFCVARSEQEATAVGEKLQVSGRRSKFVNQVLAYTRAR